MYITLKKRGMEKIKEIDAHLLDLTIENIQLRAALYDLKNTVAARSSDIQDVIKRTDDFLSKKF